MKAKCLLLLFAVSLIKLHAQPSKNISRWQQVWVRNFNQVRIGDKWSLLANFHIKTWDDFVKSLSQYIIEGGVNYHPDNRSRITFAHAYATNYPDNRKSIPLPEHRPWQQYQVNTQHGKNSIVQAFRLEERFRRRALNDSTLAGGYNFNMRLRYNFIYEVPLDKQRPTRFSLILNDEVFINVGKQIVYNYFDQNNLGLTLKCQLNAKGNLQVGYMHLFQQLNAGNRYKKVDVIRLTYIHNTTLHREVHH